MSCLIPLPLGNNPLTMSDEHILEEIYSTHVHSDTKFDAGSLFTIAENILIRSTHVVENVVQGNQGSLEQIDDKTPPASFISPLCTLKQIAAEMSCKPPGEEIAHETTLGILNQLSIYEWHAKAVLTLAAFALEYGEFWLLAHYLPAEPLAKSLAIIKRVPELTKPEALKRHRNAILEINNLVKATWEVIGIIVEFDTLNKGDTKDVPALGPALEQLPVDVFWAIISITAIVTQIDCLTTDSEKRQDLSHFGQKINIILSKLKKQRTLVKQQIEEAEYYRILKKLFQTATEIMEVFKVLIFWKDTPQAPPIYDNATKTLVNIEVLKKKDVFLFISTLDIMEEEISIFLPIYDHIAKIGNQHKIVWVPIVEEWNDEQQKKIECLKSKMPWYVLQYFAPIKGIKYIREEWQFKKKPLVVVLNPQGKILHPNAFHMIQVWGLKGFPFTISKEESLTQSSIWIDSLVAGFDAKFSWEEKNVIIYGGKHEEWIQQFTKCTKALAVDAVIKEAKISIELLCLESEQPNVVSSFWKGVESLFVTKMHNTTNTITQQVEKLLSYKNETGWALLTKGYDVVLVGHETTVMETVVKFDKWKDVLISKSFEIAFKEQHDMIASSTVHICSHLEIPNVAGKIPDTIECPDPDCHRIMEVFISYRCCHNGIVANAEH